MFFLFSRRNKEVEQMGENRDKLKVAAGHSQKSKNYWFICYGFIIHPQHNPLRDHFYNKITKITTTAPETAANRKQTSFNNYYSIFTDRYEPLIIKINGRENLSSICRKIQQNSSDLNLPSNQLCNIFCKENRWNLLSKEILINWWIFTDQGIFYTHSFLHSLQM